MKNITLTNQFGLWVIEKYTKFNKAVTLLVTEDADYAQREYDRLTGRTARHPVPATA